jgi:hypothetical protein
MVSVHVVSPRVSRLLSAQHANDKGRFPLRVERREDR